MYSCSGAAGFSNLKILKIKLEETMNTQQRRDRFLMLLSVRRKVTIRELMRELHVCRNTILRDIEYLTPFACFYTQAGGNGGIYADEGWYYRPPVLTPAMQKALMDILDGRDPDRDVIRCILESFGTKNR